MDDVTGDSAAAPPAPAGAGTLVAGRYEVRARLGRGAAKEVYLAHDRRLDRDVALALVVGAGDGDAGRARVEREARVTGRLGDHPNVVTVYDAGEADGVPYLVLRAMSRGSVADVLAAGPPPLPDALRIARDVAAALAHAHAHAVVHRDVKPDNVWLAQDGTAALGDFGVAHLLDGDRPPPEAGVVGTVRYVAPEQIRGEVVGPATDLYALGVTLYELLTGHPPFGGPDAAAVFAQHLAAAPVAPSTEVPDLPPALERLVLALLAKDPARRPASADAVAEALAALAPPPSDAAPVPAARRVIAVLAARVEHPDPEVAHALLARCAAAVQEHGGTVEPQLGSVVVGLFGRAGARGDDALRAARAADALTARADGRRLRLGLEAGEVFVSGGASGAVAGEPIAAAGRLADRAAPGTIRLGPAIRAALGRDVEVDAATGRLLALHAERPALLRGPTTPFVGRTPEREALRAAFARAREHRCCELVCVIAAPGLGKSRLVGEVLGELGPAAAVLAAGCPAYGEGSALRPLRDLVRAVGGDDPAPRLTQLLRDDPQAVGVLLGACGLSDEPVAPEEAAWALRRLLEQLARDRPVVVAVEDVHWAHDPLLELLDQVVSHAADAPILLVALARPELLERRPAWAVPGPHRTAVTLDALDGAAARELARRLGADDADAARIAARAEGNPLFVEQLVAVDAEADALPVSIQAVLAARIDALAPAQRTLLQRAAVEGRTFHAGALAALLGDGAGGTRAHLVALARQGLVTDDAPQYAGEEAFRFTHALIREAAYAGVPRARAAELHLTLAAWLEATAGAPDEVVAHHLERACVLRAPLSADGAPPAALAARAARRLRGAARDALAHGDPGAAVDLLGRAVALLGPAAAADGLPAAHGAALFAAGRLSEAAAVLDDAVAAAPTAALRARAQVERELLRLEADPGVGLAAVAAVAAGALHILRAAGDDAGQARAWALRAHAAWTAGRVGDADAAWEQAVACAGRDGDEREVVTFLSWRATAAVLGPLPVDAALALCATLRDRVAGSPVAVASMLNPMASLHAMRGELAEAERDLAAANATLHQLGSLYASVSHHEALVRLVSGQPDLAERPLRAGLATLQAMGDRALLATTTAMLAQAVFAQGGYAEAEALCGATAEAAAPDDIVTQMIWRAVRAKLLARAGRHEEAIVLARDAVALVAPTDLLSHHGDAMLDLAEVLETCSSAHDALGPVQAALSLYEQKGNAAGAARAHGMLSRLNHGG